MRDENRIREKLELSLDSRQAVSLGIGALLALGVVFVLGVMVGKQLAPVKPTQPADLLTALDKLADAGKVPLTFQQELTAPAPKPAPVAAPKAAEPKPAAKVAEPSKPAVAVAPDPIEAKPAAAEPPPSPKMDAKLAQAFSAAKESAPAAAAVPVPTDGFTVQVAASQQRDDANTVMEKLRGSGLRPYLIDADIPGKGHWYRVRLGSFKTKDDAEKYVRDLKRETGFAAFVTNAK